MTELKVFSNKPYFDDFDKTKNFQRVLFKPGVPVQTRELNQLQTILQNQIKSGAQYSIGNGARINGGETKIVRRLPFVKLLGLQSPLSTYVGAKISRIQGSSSRLTAEIVAIIGKTATDPDTLYVQYLDTDLDTGLSQFSANQSLVIQKQDGSIEQVTTVASSAVGDAQGFQVSEGIYFLNGQFVYVPKQFTVINKYSTEDLGREISVGFSVYESVVTPQEDFSLYDNAFGTPNESAPGANRYRVQALLVTKTDEELMSSETVISEDSFAVPTDAVDVKNYFEIAKIKFGSVQPRPRIDSETSILDQTLARRTYDEEGDFVVDDFVLTTVEHLDTRQFKIGSFQQVATKVTITILQHGILAGDSVRVVLKNASGTIVASGNFVVQEIPSDSQNNQIVIITSESINRTGTAEVEYKINNGLYQAVDGGAEDKIGLVLDKGKAYVRGYEIQTDGNTYLETDKARTTQFEELRIVQLQYSQAVIVYLPSTNPKLGSIVNLLQGSTTIGTAYARGFSYETNVSISGVNREAYRLDLIDVKFNNGKQFSDITSVNSITNSFSATIVPSTVYRSFELDPQKSSLVFPTPYSDIKTILPKLFTRFYEFNDATESAGANQPTTIQFGAVSGEQFDANVSSYTVFINRGGTPFYGRPLSVTLTNDSQTARLDVSNLVGNNQPGHSATIIAKTTRRDITTRDKISTYRQQTIAAASSVTLDRCDVYQIISILDDRGNDITKQYELDTGARDTIYDFSSIHLRPGYASPSGNLSISYNFFNHQPGDVFTAESYNGNIDYSKIPTYKGKSLADFIDFRQRKNSNGTLEEVGAHYFVQNQPITCNAEFYLPRYDTISLSSTGEFNVSKGVASLQPVIPAIPSDSVLLHTVYVPAYTYSVKDVLVKSSTIKRYGMKEIGAIVKRLENVENATSLSLLETRINSKLEFDKFRNGFFVDNFSSEYSADTEDQLHQVSYNTTQGYITAKQQISGIDLQVQPATIQGLRRHADGIITLDYTSENYIANNQASSVVKIQQLVTSDYIGYLTLNPTTDIWTDSISVNNYQFVDNLVDNRTPPNTSVRVDWAREWITTNSSLVSSMTEGRINTSIFSDQSILNRIGTQFTTQTVDISSTTTTNQYIGTTTNVSPQTFIREKIVKFEGFGFKPNTRVYLKFDGIDLSKYTGPTESTIGQPLVVTSSGYISGVFKIPNESGSRVLLPAIPGHENCSNPAHRARYVENPPGLRFMTGIRSVVLSDKVGNTESYDYTYGQTQYSALGNLKTNTQNFVTTRTTILSSTSVTTSQSISSAQVTGVNTRRVVTQVDPIAQSFFIEPNGTSGAFITGVDLYFGPGISPTTNKELVQIELRNMINGYPGPEVAINGIAIVQASQIFGSLDASAATRFTFPSPVYVQAGIEYCFVVKTKSTKLNLWKSVLGEKEVVPGETTPNSGSIISKQPYLGSMFLSQNDFTWTADQASDLKFKIYRAEFQSLGKVELDNRLVNGQAGSRTDEHILELDENPFRTTTGSNILTISNLGHSFKIGDRAKLTNPGVTSTNIGNITFNGIPAAQIYDAAGLVITAIDTPNYGDIQVQVTANATASGAFGGTSNFINRVITYYKVQLLSDAVVHPSTNLQYQYRGRDFANNGLSVAQDIHVQQDLVLNVPYVIKSYGDGSSTVISTLSTNNSFVSPVLDEQRMQLIVSKNIINSAADTLDFNNRGSVARYMQKKVSTINPSNTIDVFVDANIPAGASIKIYFRTGQTDVSSAWTELPLAPSYQLLTTEDPNRYNEIKFSTDSLGILPEFFVSQIKIVMTSTNQARAPKVKNFRSIINSKI